MGLFEKKIGTVFLKEDSDAQEFVKKLEELKERSQGELRYKIEKQINIANYGILGEKNVAFELKNSGMDMYVLHDIYLEYGEMSAQIDYIVVTRKHVYVIECKNLIGDIEIDNNGNFIRRFELFGKHVREGIYSPITQNERHLRILKEIRKEMKKNFLTKFMFEQAFQNTYKSIVVLANPKTCLNARYAKKEIKNQVIRADQLIAYIKKTDASDEGGKWSSQAIEEIARFYLGKCKPAKSDYAQKYEELLKLADENDVASNDEKIQPESKKEVYEKPDSAEEELVKRLKKFRLDQSRKEGIKPYFIFNDSQMRDLISKGPKNKEELLNISGFGPKKVEKYGDVVLEIISGEVSAH